MGVVSINRKGATAQRKTHYSLFIYAERSRSIHYSLKKVSNFKFKQFEIQQDKCAMKIGTDAVLLGAWANIVQAFYILDIGTGTGILALMAAQRNPNAVIHAVEIEAAAQLQAAQNIRNSPWAQRIQVFPQSIQDFTQTFPDKQYDSILSNPPYFDHKASSYISDEARQTARNTSELSFETLLHCIQKLLHPQGNCSVILPVQEGNNFIKQALAIGFYLKTLTKVQPRADKEPNRLLIELVKYPCEVVENELTIRNAGKGQQDYTEGYKELHGGFYLAM